MNVMDLFPFRPGWPGPLDTGVCVCVRDGGVSKRGPFLRRQLVRDYLPYYRTGFFCPKAIISHQGGFFPYRVCWMEKASSSAPGRLLLTLLTCMYVCIQGSKRDVAVMPRERMSTAPKIQSLILGELGRISSRALPTSQNLIRGITWKKNCFFLVPS